MKTTFRINVHPTYYLLTTSHIVKKQVLLQIIFWTLKTGKTKFVIDVWPPWYFFIYRVSKTSSIKIVYKKYPYEQNNDKQFCIINKCNISNLNSVKISTLPNGLSWRRHVITMQKSPCSYLRFRFCITNYLFKISVKRMDCRKTVSWWNSVNTKTREKTVQKKIWKFRFEPGVIWNSVETPYI